MEFCTKMQIDHTLEDPEVPIMEVLQVFGVRVCDRSFSNRVPGVRAATVAAACCAVAEVRLLEGRPDSASPLDPAAATCKKASPECSATGGTRTPPPQREKAIPLGFVVFAVTHAAANVFSQCWEDLIVLALFFCLQ